MKVYETHDLKNKELPFIFHKNWTYHKGKGFGSPNWHENIEILYIKEGSGIIANGMQHINVKRGDIVVINTNNLHSFGAFEDHLTYDCLIIDRSFGLSNGLDTNCISFNDHFRDQRIANLMQSISNEWLQSSEDTFYTLKIRSYVQQIMCILCVEYSHPKEPTENNARILTCVKSAIEFIQSSYDQNISLEDVAEFVGINKYYLAHEFHKITNYSFVAYLNSTRCKVAKKLLLQGDNTISEIAKICGFESSSYFAKVFFKYEGVRPSEIKRSAMRSYGTQKISDNKQHQL